ncbi:serine hydrolase [Neolewinella aurantiaca]|uniref:Serine hydrolase n=1 Tax=Neolewinella aurantiaca TaxID=2602767 RepID=A0A5C7FAE0_9BACT|nr:serine hydrolase [Neolewinella aurantiaca]TXF87103.1 serine hydrolase [Neolewinella aurantiaca]
MRISLALRRFLTLLVLLVVLVFAAFLWFKPLLNIGAGYAAKHACSCHFLQGRELEEIREHDLNFSVLGMVGLEVSGNEVESSFFGLVDRRAVFREGVGCTLINDEEKPLAEVKGAAAGAKKVEGALVTGPAALTEALDFGMAPVPGGAARGLVVMQNGEIIAERYAPGYDQNTLLLGWSMTKTLTALTLGKALEDELASGVSPEELVATDHLFPEVWTDSARQLVTIADLLHMNSGLSWNEGYGSLTDATIMLHEMPDMAAYAIAAPAVAPRNTVWNYSSGTTNIIAEIASRRGGESSFADLYHELFSDVAPSLLIEPSQAGLPVGSSYGWATARDWANLGQFMLQDGIWNGDTLLTPGWIDYLRKPVTGSEGTYGGQTWLPGPDMPSLPKDAFLMRGFQDQRVFVIPSRNLVIARLGHGEDKSTDFDGLVARLMDVID